MDCSCARVPAVCVAVFSKDCSSVMVLNTQLRADAKSEDVKALEDALVKDVAKESKWRIACEPSPPAVLAF